MVGPDMSSGRDDFRLFFFSQSFHSGYVQAGQQHLQVGDGYLIYLRDERKVREKVGVFAAPDQPFQPIARGTRCDLMISLGSNQRPG
jgi:hypothetical protein